MSKIGAGAHACESGKTERRPDAKRPTYTKVYTLTYTKGSDSDTFATRPCAMFDFPWLQHALGQLALQTASSFCTTYVSVRLPQQDKLARV
jgi:hypothetical protein